MFFSEWKVRLRMKLDISKLLIQKGRLENDLLRLADFGKVPGGGLTRTALSDADLKARTYVKRRMAEAGLHVREDGAANIIGRYNPAKSASDLPCIAIGSHIDTVPFGGKFDGALGVCAGLEMIRAIQESKLAMPSPLEILIFTDEEGAHYAGTFGSRAMVDLLSESEIYRSRADGQPSLAESLRRIGRDPNTVAQAVRSPSEFRAFIELHIEQGPVLSSLGIPIGIVEGIVSVERDIIRVVGQFGHAGTTPMVLRDDALVKAAKLITAIHQAVINDETGAVGTIGDLQVHPGVFNAIPGKVEMLLDLRSMKDSTLAALHTQIKEILRSEGGASMEVVLKKEGVLMDPGIMNLIESACRDRNFPSQRLGSGAAHDAMSFGTKGIPTGMIFIPCDGGRSHCPDESICWDDAVKGAQILADTVMRIGLGHDST
jgi:N-carbamoyl-L-amino-acid hydrolase